MINVDGNYEEIVEYLDNNPVNGVDYVGSHGIVGTDDTGKFYSLNVGLFSINTGLDGHYGDTCSVCKTPEAHGLFTVRFSEPMDKDVLNDWGLSEDEVNTPHLIYF